MPDLIVSGNVDTMLGAADNAAIRSAIGLGQTDAPTFLAQTLTGQSLTGTQATSLLDLSTTWLSTTGAPTAIKLNVTDTASNAASKLMDLQVGGASLISIEKSGLIVARASSTSTNTNPLTAPNGITFAGSNGRIYISSPQSPGNGLMVWQDNGAGTVMFLNNQFLRIQNTTLLQWCSPDSGLTPSLSLAQDAAGILAQRNGTNAQALRVANSVGALPLVDYDRGVFDFKTTTNTLRIGTENGGTYTTARPIDFVVGGVVRMSISSVLTQIIGNVGVTGYVAGTLGFGGWFNLSGNAGTHGLAFGSGHMIRWGSATTNLGQTGDLGIGHYADGVAEINNATAGVFRDLRVRSVIQQPPATITPASNGDLVVEATSNTLLTFKFKGSDGTVRSGTMVVA
jgi:hypothetical protein